MNNKRSISQFKKPRNRRQIAVRQLLIALLTVTVCCGHRLAAEETTRLRVTLEIVTPLVHRNTPMDPTIDFAELIEESGLPGRLDPDSIEVFNQATRKSVPRALGPDFAYGDRGRVEWVVADPEHSEFEIRFNVGPQRSPIASARFVPQIGTGDLLRYNAAAPRPVTLKYAIGLHDVTGDGRLDFVGAWNYARRPGQPWSGVVCHPAVESAQPLRFADLQRFRARASQDDDVWRPFGKGYTAADFADFNSDGHLDLVTTNQQSRRATFYMNTGEQDPGGLPRFERSDALPVDGWMACRCIDCDQDHDIDLVIDGTLIRNVSESGWPFEADAPVPLDAGRQPCFLDLDGDQRLDAVCLSGGETVQPGGYRVAWKRNLGGNPPRFGAEEILQEIDVPFVTLIESVEAPDRPGLLVQHDVYQQVSFYNLTSRDSQQPRFERQGRLLSESAVLGLSDQAWPHMCDWDSDGDLDLLVGGGYGWPRIVINEGTRARPAFAEPRTILSEGEPIRLVRNELLGPPENWHDMGYTYPRFVDWDGDGLRDLLLPNETNRIFWYANIGNATKPEFGRQQQIVCEEFPDSPEQRAQSARRAIAPDSNNGVYPLEPERPFMWRTAAAFADWNGDGLTDFITHDGAVRKATLFVQRKDADGQFRLHKERPVLLNDGRMIDDTIVQRGAHWTESFTAVDWDSDGLQDLVYSIAGAHSGALDGGSIYLLRNSGTAESPEFEPPRTMRCFGEPIRITNHGPHPWVGDFDGDEKPDIVACVEWSVYPYYSHAALSMPDRPEFRLGQPQLME